MPAGDLIDADYQVELNGLLTGLSTDYVLAPPGITGLGLAAAKTQDIDPAGQDGTVPNADFLAPRVILIPYNLNDHESTKALEDYATLETAFAPRVDTAELHIQLPGLGHFYFVGKPRSLELVLLDLKSGAISAIGEFLATDPTRHAFT